MNGSLESLVTNMSKVFGRKCLVSYDAITVEVFYYTVSSLQPQNMVPYTEVGQHCRILLNTHASVWCSPLSCNVIWFFST